MKRRSGILWLGTGVILAILAALLSFRLLSSVAPTSAAGPEETVTVPVVVAREDVPVRTLLTEEDVMVRRMPPELVPVGAATTLDQVLGKISKIHLAMGEVVLVERLADPLRKGEDVLFTMPEDKLLIALPGDDLMSHTGLLKPGDKIDILYSWDVAGGSMRTGSPEAPASISALQNLEIQAIITAKIDSGTESVMTGVGQIGLNMESGESAILVAVDPQDALVLKYLRDVGGILDFALRAPTNDQFMDTEAVTREYLSDRYQIQAGSGCSGGSGCSLDWSSLGLETLGK
ncbi:MAG: Flp pilus assembly protein CpaB [Anaerolineae bacterium]|nr:Flp pilus assembly protein CpaB [Anaerolineae bacterium]